MIDIFYMDIVKAREKARLKEQAKEKPQTPAEPASTAQTPAPPGPPGRETVAASPDKPAARKKPKAKPEPEKKRPPVEQRPPIKEKPAEKKAVVQKPPVPGVEAEKIDDADIFVDESFGEGLPSHLVDKSASVAILGEDEVSELKEIEDFDMDVEREPMPGPGRQRPPVEKKTPEEKKAPDKKPIEPPARPAAQPAPPPAPARPQTAPAEPARAEEKRPALQPVPLVTEVAPKDQETHERHEQTSWLMDRLVTDEDDFFALVSEDLYRREFGEVPEEEKGNQLELLSFDLAKEVYAARLIHIQQIIKMREITRVPRAPEYVLGIISLRGVIIPIFDLRRRMGLPLKEVTRETRIIVLNERLRSVGLMVDRVRQVVRIQESTVEPPPPIFGGIESEYLEGIGRSGELMLILLDLHKVLGIEMVH